MKFFFYVQLCLSLFYFALPSAIGQKGQNRSWENRPKIGQLSGEIVDSLSGKGLEFTTIAMLTLSSDSLITGGITNKKGRFLITEIPVGAYAIKVSFLGYEDKIIKPVKLSRKHGLEQDLGAIKLSPSSALMEDIEITADRPFVTMEIDKKVYDATQLTVAQGGSAIDILENIPAVTVDIDGNVSLRGSTNVTILIDGKPAALTGGDRQAILEQFPSSVIESVEVITNPSAKYDPDGMSGILNIVLKKNKLKGLTGQVRLNIGTGDNYGFSGQINYRNKKWNVFANYGLRFADLFNLSSLDQTITTVDSLMPQIHSIQKRDGNQVRLSNNIRAGIEFSPDSKNTISLTTNGGARSRQKAETLDTNFDDGNGNVFINNYTQTESFRSRNSVDLDLGWRHNFKQKGHELSFNARQGWNVGRFNESIKRRDYLNDLTNQIGEAGLQQTTDDGANSLTRIQLDYTLPIKELAKLEAGIQSTLRSTDSDFFSESLDTISMEMVNDTGLINVFNYKEDVHAVYSTYGHKFGKFGFKAGLRLEQAYTTATLENTNQRFKNDYFSYYPSVHLSYEINKTDQLQVSYSRRVNRPRRRSINPFPSYSNPLSRRQGNPFLQPEYINSFELGYLKRWKKLTLNGAVYYNQINNVIRSFVRLEDNGITTTTYENLSTGKSYGLDVSANARIQSWWNLNFSANVFQNVLDGSNLEADLSAQNFGYFGRFLSNWKLKDNFSIQLSGFYHGPINLPQGIIRSFSMVGLALNKKVFKEKGTIGVRISDIFLGRVFRYDTTGDSFTRSSIRRRESRIITLNFTYNFGKFKADRRSRNRGGGDDGGDLEID